MERSAEYWAGFFDGEGCVSIVKGPEKTRATLQYSIAASVANCHEGIVRDMQRDFGGVVTASKHHLKNPRYKPAWKWMARSRTALGFFYCVRPHLVIKAEETDIALALQRRITDYQHQWSTTFHGGMLPISRDELDAREALWAKLRAHPNRRSLRVNHQEK